LPNTILIVVALTISVISAKAGEGWDTPKGLAFDRSGNLFVGDFKTDTIFKVAPEGTRSAFATGVHWPNNIAFDATGNLYVLSPSQDYKVGGRVLKFSPDGAMSTFASGVGFPLSLAFDSAGNLFVSEMDSGSIFKFAPDGSKSTFATGAGFPDSIAFDSAGNLFALDKNSGSIFKFTPDGKKSTFATGIGSTVLTFDSAGNLLAEDSNSNTIFKFAPTGAKSAFTKINSSKGFQSMGFAFDPTGNLFASDLITGAIFRFTSDGTQSVFVKGRTEPAAAAETEPEEKDSSAGLPEKYAKNYLIASETLSPNKKFAVIYPTEDDVDFPGGANYLVSLKPFAILGKLATKRPYFKNESHGGLSAEWSDDNSVAIITLESKWGPGDIFLIEFKDGKVARATNMLAKLHDLLVADYQKAKAARYNEYYDFIFETEDTPIYKLDGKGQLRFNALATTDPKGVSDERIWKGRAVATWAITQGKFTSQKVKREFAGVPKDAD
jgi:sugar lactone lactonase YvrE